MSEKEPQVETKDAKHLVNMDMDTILSMVNRVAKEFVASGEKSKELASQLPDKELFNLFFALEFFYRTEDGGQLVPKLESEENTLFLYAVIISEIENRTGLSYNNLENFIV
jgi:hypothetical protein